MSKRIGITVYRADDGSLHETRKDWRARQSWLELVRVCRTELYDDVTVLASGLLARRDEVTRLLRHAVEPTEEGEA